MINISGIASQLHITDPALPDDGPARRRTRLAVSCDCSGSWW